MVYFIGNAEKQLVKIGKAKNVDKRKRAIQVGFPYTLETFLIIEGNEAIEKTLHLKFKDKHLRGEWFILDEEIYSFINNPTIEYNKWYKDMKDTTIRYEENINDEIEELYKQRMSNIKIAEQLNINISKVRRIIRTRKLANKYRVYKEIDKLTSQYNKERNIRKKHRNLYRKGMITKEELEVILSQYPVKRNGRKPLEYYQNT